MNHWMEAAVDDGKIEDFILLPVLFPLLICFHHHLYVSENHHPPAQFVVKNARSEHNNATHMCTP